MKSKKLILFVLVLMFILTLPTQAFATDPFTNINLTPPKDNAGLTQMLSDMNMILYLILTGAGFWVIGCIIFAGVKLSSSQGNAQNRTQGFIGLAMAMFGGWVVYKCLVIAGWVSGFGSTV